MSSAYLGEEELVVFAVKIVVSVYWKGDKSINVKLS
jgi:hypothetical protein